MSKKKTKIPKLFRKKYSGKELNNKILKRIHIPGDRKMVKDLFIPSEDGKLEILQDIPENVLNRLAPLAKSIKKNRGALTTWKAVILLTILALALLFNLFFKDRLLKGVLEKGLELTFRGEATVEDPTLSLLKGEFSYESLQIADGDKLTRNLIETGPARFKISMAELSRKNIHIEESSLTGVQWDTPRASEAEALSSQNKEKDSDKKSPVDLLALTPDEMDYKALLEDQKENLKSLKLLGSGNEQIEEFTQKWSGTYEAKEKELSALNKKVQDLQSLNIPGINSPEKGLEALKKIEPLSREIEESAKSLRTLQKEFESERRELSGLYDQLENSIDADVAYLNGLMDFSGGDVRNLASSAAEKYIRARWNGYYEKGLKALEIYERLQSDREKEKPSGSARREGRIIPFPSAVVPDFLIREILLSGGISETGQLQARIRSLSDSPDKLDEPVTFTAGWSREKSRIDLAGFVDSRSGGETPFEMTIEAPGNPVVMDEGVPALQIKTLKGNADISGVSRLAAGKNALQTELDINLSTLKITLDDSGGSEGIIAGAVGDILNEIDLVKMKASLLVSRDGIEDIRVSTDLDNILAGRIGSYIREISADAAEKVREALTASLVPYLEENKTLQSVMEKLGAESLDQLTSTDDMLKLVEKKKDEINNQADAIRKDAEEKAEEALEDALKDAAKKIKIPGF